MHLLICCFFSTILSTQNKAFQSNPIFLVTFTGLSNQQKVKPKIQTKNLHILNNLRKFLQEFCFQFLKSVNLSLVQGNWILFFK